jgi:hypothetical protein
MGIIQSDDADDSALNQRRWSCLLEAMTDAQVNTGPARLELCCNQLAELCNLST